MSSRLLLGVALAFATAGTTGCLLLPIPNTREVSPAVTGRLLREDGTPMADVPIAATSLAESSGCAKVAATGRTDPEGRFTLPTGRRHSSWLLLTMMENLGRAWYGICAASPDDTTLHVHGTVQGTAGSDELTCLQWTFDERTNISCNSLALQPVYFDGEWSSGPRRGFYRIILEDDPVHWRWSFGFIQWVAIDPVTGAHEVRATTWLPKAPAEFLEHRPEIVLDGGRWYLTGLATAPTALLRHRSVRFELGGPGELWRLPG